MFSGEMGKFLSEGAESFLAGVSVLVGEAVDGALQSLENGLIVGVHVN